MQPCYAFVSSKNITEHLIKAKYPCQLGSFDYKNRGSLRLCHIIGIDCRLYLVIKKTGVFHHTIEQHRNPRPIQLKLVEKEMSSRLEGHLGFKRAMKTR